MPEQTARYVMAECLGNNIDVKGIPWVAAADDVLAALAAAGFTIARTDALAAAEAEVQRLRSLVEKFLRTDWKDEPQALWLSIDRLTEEAEELLAKDATP